MRRSTLALFALLAVATTGCDKIKLAIDKIKGRKPAPQAAARPAVPSGDTAIRPVVPAPRQPAAHPPTRAPSPAIRAPPPPAPAVPHPKPRVPPVPEAPGTPAPRAGQGAL